MENKVNHIAVTARAAGFPGLLSLMAAGGLVGLSVRNNLSEVVGGAAAISTVGPLTAILGFFPLLLLIRFCNPRTAAAGGAAWGAGVAILAAGADPAMWLAYIAGPAAFAVTASFLTRRIGFRAIPIAALWLLIELAMMSSGLAPRGMLAAMTEESALFSGIAAWLGSIHVALLLALVSAGVVHTVHAVIRRLARTRFARTIRRPRRPTWFSQRVNSFRLLAPSMPRAPPVPTHRQLV